MTAKVAPSALEKDIHEFLEYMEIEKNLSPLTIRDYTHYLFRFATWAKQNHIHTAEEIDAKSIKRFRLGLSRQLASDGQPISVRTQSYYVIALRSLLKWLSRQDRVVVSPDKIELPKVEQVPVQFLRTEQMGRLLDQPDVRTVRGLRDRALLEVLFSTGLRVSELVSLDRDQVNTEQREFGVMGKGRKHRIVFLSTEAAEWLERYLNQRGDSWAPVFIRHAKGVDPTHDGEGMRLTTRSVQRLVEKYRKLAKLPLRITPHGIRHTFATDLLRNGAGLRDVQEMLGHKNISTTQIYTHVTKPELRASHERFHTQTERPAQTALANGSSESGESETQSSE